MTIDIYNVKFGLDSSYLFQIDISYSLLIQQDSCSMCHIVFIGLGASYNNDCICRFDQRLYINPFSSHKRCE